MQPIALPPPFAGVWQKTPKISIEPPFCESLLNFNVTQDGIELRHGDSVETRVTGSTRTGIRLGVYDSLTFFMIESNSSTSKTDIIDGMIKELLVCCPFNLYNLQL